MIVSTLDWHPLTNKIISGSYDKNLYVWSYNESRNEWAPTLVTFKQKLSILSVRWNKHGDKFVAATTTNKLTVGYYEESLNWWKGEDIKAHKSAITSVCFSPDGMAVLSGSTDLKVMLHSVYLEELDKNKTPNDFSDENSKVSINVIIIALLITISFH